MFSIVSSWGLVAVLDSFHFPMEVVPEVEKLTEDDIEAEDTPQTLYRGLC